MRPISTRPQDEKPYLLPCSNQPISSNELKVSRIALGLFSTVSAVGSLYLSYPVFLLSGGVCAISSLSLLGSFFMIKKAPPLLPISTLQTVEETLQQEMHQLSGIDREGYPQACTNENFKSLVERLHCEKKLNKMLNGLSKYDITACQCYKLRPLTPLQHWAKRGDLYKVRLLIEKGAADQCLGKYALTSALFESLLAGHLPVTQHLLSVGANSYLTLNSDQRLASFLPKLIYEYCDRGVFRASHKSSLNTFLSHFQSYAPQDFAYQLSIPITKGEHPKTYVKKYCREFEGKNDLLECLSAYKKDDIVFNPNQLSDNPCTLEEVGQQKSNI